MLHVFKRKWDLYPKPRIKFSFRVFKYRDKKKESSELRNLNQKTQSRDFWFLIWWDLKTKEMLTWIPFLPSLHFFSQGATPMMKKIHFFSKRNFNAAQNQLRKLFLKKQLLSKINNQTSWIYTRQSNIMNFYKETRS